MTDIEFDYGNLCHCDNCVNDIGRKAFIQGLQKAQRLILSEGENGLFSVHYFSKHVSDMIREIVNQLDDKNHDSHTRKKQIPET